MSGTGDTLSAEADVDIVTAFAVDEYCRAAFHGMTEDQRLTLEFAVMIHMGVSTLGAVLAAAQGAEDRDWLRLMVLAQFRLHHPESLKIIRAVANEVREIVAAFAGQRLN